MAKMLTPEQVKDLLTDAIYANAGAIVAALLHTCTKCSAQMTAEALLQSAGLDRDMLLDYWSCMNGHQGG